MNVKINIKKLFRMQTRIKHLEQDNQSLRDQEKILLDSDESLRKQVREAEASLQRMHDRIEAWEQEVEDLQKDRKDWEDAARKAADNL